MEKTDEIQELLSSINTGYSSLTSMKSRLLILAVGTSDILNLYLSTQKCITAITPQPEHQNQVLDPIKEYIRKRPDATSKIVHLLISSHDADGERELDENDITSLLNIFEDHSIFAKQYLTILADQLIHNPSFDVDEQV